MEVIKNILINYWPQILAGLIFIASFILQCFRKNKTFIFDDSAYSELVTYVSEAEEKYGAGNGSDKMKYVIQRYCYNHHLNATNYISKAIKFIVERILSTPQKKNER